jgi:FtsH-binding integral membrane protein
MSYSNVDHIPVAALDEDTRADFIVRVYQHLAGAVVAFIAIEALLITLGVAEGIYDFVSGRSGAWLLILGAFMVGQWFVAQAAADLLNPSKQYAALFGMAALEALIFAPFLHYFFNVAVDGTTTVAAAALITVMGFAGLSLVAFITRRDLSVLRPMVMYGFVAALVLIVAAVLFGLELGIWFSVAMIALAGMAILYQTQTILRHYPQQAHVAGALALFGSLMTMFWYVLRLLGQIRS